MGAAIKRAMRAFAFWVTSRPYRLVLATIAFFQLLAPVSAALLVLGSLQRGPSSAMLSALIALAGITGLGLAVGGEPWRVLGMAAPLLLAAAASGALLHRSRSLSLAYQATVIALIGGALLVLAAFPSVSRLGELWLSELMMLFQSLGMTDAQLADLGSIVNAQELMRVLLISLLVSVLAGLMLGYWWYGLLDEQVRFGASFRALKLGRVAGIALMIIVVLGQLSPMGLIWTVAPMAVMSFLFQGLAVMHARSRSDKWPGAVVVLVYVVLFSPLTFFAILGLSGVGLLDNVFALRARGEPKA
jgi:hypothetical protein